MALPFPKIIGTLLARRHKGAAASAPTQILIGLIGSKASDPIKIKTAALT
jgi:hypothetical protein